MKKYNNKSKKSKNPVIAVTEPQSPKQLRRKVELSESKNGFPSNVVNIANTQF